MLDFPLDLDYGTRPCEGALALSQDRVTLMGEVRDKESGAKELLVLSRAR